MTGTEQDARYHGPWNLIPRRAGPWECSLHGPVAGGNCAACRREADEHARECGPSVSCPWWQRITVSGRRNGKTAAARESVVAALEAGEHVHMGTAGGMLCEGGDPDCPLPRREG